MTISGPMRVRHRKSPGSHTRWSHGRQGSGPARPPRTAARAGRHGAHAPAASGRTARRSARRSSPRCASARCRHPRTRPRAPSAPARPRAAIRPPARCDGRHRPSPSAPLARPRPPSPSSDVAPEHDHPSSVPSSPPAPPTTAANDLPTAIGGTHCRRPRARRRSRRAARRPAPPVARPSSAAPRSVNRHLDAIALRIRRRPERVIDRGRADPTGSAPSAAARSRGRRATRRRVHPPAARHIVAHAHPRPRRPRQPGASRAAVEIDGDVHPPRPQTHGQSRTSSQTRRQPRRC